MTPGEMAGRLEREQPGKALAREIQCRWGGWHRVTPGQGGGKHGRYIAPEDWNGRDSGGRPVLDSLHGTDMVRDVPDLTASLDAAVAFVRRVCPGWTIASISEGDDKRWFAELREGHLTSYRRVAISGPGYKGAINATPAMALVAAALRALQAADGGAA